ncbi:MAG: gluconokinase [Leptolyngbya sp. SIOISBB]|nr:gluconokinase [Leptolyngbya sp. SIOISBB]
MIIILMGVSGSGKTTVGRCLADVLDWCFIEGDDLHPRSNVAKMSQGIPLTDRDRGPWLTRLRDRLVDLRQQDKSAIVTCSALKRSYRQILRPHPNEAIQFVYLKGSVPLLKSRLHQRQGHFMKAGMLQSQLTTLEEPDDAIVIDIDTATRPKQVISDVLARLNLLPNAEAEG